MTRATIIAAALGAPLALAGPAHAQGDGGMAVFVAQKCTQCHAVDGRGNKGGALDDVGSRMSSADIKAWIVDPVTMAARRQPASTRKPTMKKKPMSAGEVDALVAFLAAHKK